MNNPDFTYQPNLAFREFNIPAGSKWLPCLTGWSLMQVRQGSGYCQQSQLNHELETGTVLLQAGASQGSLHASLHGELSLGVFSVIPDRLTALITPDERHQFRLPPEGDTTFKIMPPDSLVAIKMCELLADKPHGGLLFRLKLLQLFAEFFVAKQSQAGIFEFSAEDSNAMQRLQALLKKMSASELENVNFKKLAAMTNCTTRHLSRIFNKLVGMSFSGRRAELRLARAKKLLATSNSKVLLVALECGYNSVSQFHQMFSRRYGISPGKWREKYGYGKIKGRGKKVGQEPGQTAETLPAPQSTMSLKLKGRLRSKGNYRMAT